MESGFFLVLGRALPSPGEDEEDPFDVVGLLADAFLLALWQAVSDPTGTLSDAALGA